MARPERNEVAEMAVVMRVARRGSKNRPAPREIPHLLAASYVW